MARILVPLTDDDLAVLTTALLTEPVVSTATLARRLGRPYPTVKKAVDRFRERGGWVCPLVERRCAACGDMLLTTPGPGRRVVHPACAAARHAERQRTYRRERRVPPSTRYVAAWRERNPERARELREQEKARMRALWPSLPVAVQDAFLDRLHDADLHGQELTAPLANQSGARWSADEDAYVRAHPEMAARDIALALGRTLWGVRTRRMQLRRQDEHHG